MPQSEDHNEQVEDGKTSNSPTQRELDVLYENFEKSVSATYAMFVKTSISSNLKTPVDNRAMSKSH